MDSLNFSALAPRLGTRPLYNGSSLGVSTLNGGAINWGSMWNAFKSVGSTLKNVGTKVWNSKTAQSIKKELAKTGAREKLVQGVVTGVHGALDLANQALAKQIEKRLDKAPLTEEEVAEAVDSALENPEEAPELPPKRPRDEPLLLEKPATLSKEKVVAVPEPLTETLISTTDEPPSYEEAIRTMAPAPLPPPPAPPLPAAKGPLTAPVPRKPAPAPAPAPAPLPPPVVAVAPSAPVVSAPGANWLNALNAMTGVGLRCVKRRRCYY